MKDSSVFDHLSTTDFAGKRVKIFAAEVAKGYWADRRRWVQYGLILFYLILPWIQIHGHPLLQLDILHRRFSIFGKLFFAHEVPNLVFITLSFLLGIALLTTVFGRAWCGWSCPQTVFVDRIFRKIEYWIEGDFIAQKKLHQEALSLAKLGKRALKWFLFTFFTLILSHSFLAYFVGSHESLALLRSSPSEHPAAFGFVMLFTGIVLFDFGWFREQFCLIACPYGKMQSVMMDEGSLFLAYDEKRNDCIDCQKCVRVCPTGIDVRNGLQIECIACTACADACDSVMLKIKKPAHLIGYGSQLSLQGKAVPVLRGRIILYSALLVLSLGMFTYRLSHRQDHQTEILRAVDIPYQLVKNADGTQSVINHFKIRFYNLDWDDAQVDFNLSANPELKLIRPSLGKDMNMVSSGSFIDEQFFVEVPATYFSQKSAHPIQLETHWNHQEVKSTELNLVGPELGI